MENKNDDQVSSGDSTTFKAVANYDDSYSNSGQKHDDSSEKGKMKSENQKINIPASDLPLSKFTFMMFGLSVLNWSLVMNSILSIFTTVYGYPQGADTILLGYFLSGIATSVGRLFYRSISTKITFLGFSILILANILLPVTIEFIGGMTGVVLIHLILVLVGFGISLVVSSGYAYGSLLPVNFTSFSIAGNSLGGLVGFIVWQILVQLIFDVNVKDEIQGAAWCTSIIVIIFAVINMILFYKLTKKPWFGVALAIYYKTSGIKVDPSTPAHLQTEGSRPLNYLLKDASVSIFFGFLNFLSSYIVFPEIGPYDWNGLSLNNVSIIVGVFQIFDFVGRYAGNMNKIFLVPFKGLIVLTIIRLVFIPIFIYMAMAHNSFTTNFISQFFIMLVFATSHGVAATQTLANVPRTVRTVSEKGVMGVCLNIASLGGMGLAKIVSVATKQGLNI